MKMPTEYSSFYLIHLVHHYYTVSYLTIYYNLIPQYIALPDTFFFNDPKNHHMTSPAVGQQR